MKLRFYIDYKEKKFASGKLFFLSGENILYETAMYSGSKFASEKNKGALPEGTYKIVSLAITNDPRFTYDGFGWIAGLTPMFDTDRFDLALHPDGQTVSTEITKGEADGSAGCGVNKWKKEESIKIHNLIRDGLESGTLFLEVLFTGRKR